MRLRYANRTYGTKVIQGDSATAIIDWLQVNGFAFNEKDRAVFADYIKREWVFVTAKLDAGVQGSGGKMVPPLMLWFESPYAVYPLALTGTSGHNTEVMLYVRAATRMDAGDRLPLQFFGHGYTKFRGELTPEQMQSDIILKPAVNNALYRKWEFSYDKIDYILGPFVLAVFIMVIALSITLYFTQSKPSMLDCISTFNTSCIAVSNCSAARVGRVMVRVKSVGHCTTYKAHLTGPTRDTLVRYIVISYEITVIAK